MSLFYVWKQWKTSAKNEERSKKGLQNRKRITHFNVKKKTESEKLKTKRKKGFGPERTVVKCTHHTGTVVQCVCPRMMLCFKIMEFLR